MLFFKSKTFSHRQTAMIGFVLAVISLLSIAIITYIFPHLGAWLNNNGVVQMDLFLLVFFVILLLAVQGLVLFGFPLYYAQDKKSHMTGFQILVYTLMWMLGLVLICSVIMVQLYKQDTYTLDELTPSVETETSVTE